MNTLKAIILFILTLCLTLITGCGGDDGPTGPPPPTTGAVEVTTNTGGPDPDDYDGDGYAINVDGANSQPADTSDTVLIEGLEEGSHNVELSGTSETCTVESDNPQMVEVTAGETATVSFEVFCKEVLRNQIVFQSNREPSGIYVMDEDGANVKRISDPGRDPVISPNGTQIAYSSGGNIIIMDADGSNMQQVTDSGNDFSPSWLPDGTQLAFQRSNDDNSVKNIYTINADGSGLTQITTDGGSEEPAWSPDGTSIAYRSGLDIFTISLEGGGPQLITDQSSNVAPSWSPDGSQLAFSSSRGGSFEIYMINVDGTGLRQLTTQGGRNSSWSPDGTSIVFDSDRNGNGEIYAINTDGTSLTNLTVNAADDRSPDWSPVE